MPASQSATQTRRTIQRFALESVMIDGKPNVYKIPQLVLKPQLDLAPRRPYTGSRPRMPVWRHFLMVHVKDKADELVKLDLATFKQSPVVLDPVLRHSIRCLPSERSFIFQHPSATENGSSILRIVLQEVSDFEVVLRELGALSISVEYEQASQGRGQDTGVGFGLLAQANSTGPPVYVPVKHLRQINSSVPPLTTAPSSQGPYPSYLDGFPHGAIVRRPPSQPAGQPSNLPFGQRPWSPAFVPLRPATTMGVPGVLGEGIYKVSRIGSASSGRPRIRRTSTILEQQGPRLYTVSKHFDKTLSRRDIAPASTDRYLGRRLSSSLQSDDTVLGVAMPSNLNPNRAAKHHNPGQEDRPLMRMASVLEGIPDNTQYPVGMRRLRTIDDASNQELSAGFDDTRYQSFPFGVGQGQAEFGFSQPEATPRAAWPSDDASITSSSQTLTELPTRQEMEDDWLLRISQIQHEGLYEASMVWDDFMGRAGAEMASVESQGAVSGVLAKYEGEFARRWDTVLAATAQRMRDARARGFAS